MQKHIAIYLLLLSLFLSFKVATNRGFAEELSLVPQTLNIRTSGYPVPHFLLKALAYDAVTREISKRKLPHIIMLKDKISAFDFLSPAETTLIDVPVLLKNGSKRKIKHIYVIAKNEDLGEREDDYLMISNDPEVIPRQGILFQGHLRNWESARLLYYHTAPSDESYDVVTSIHNPSKWPIEVFASVGLGGPSNDGIYAGHVATLRFMNRLKYKAGRIIKIPPKSSYKLIHQRLSPATRTGTAIAKIWLVSGAKAKIEIKAQKPGTRPSNLPVIDCSWDDGRISYFVPSSSIDIKRDFDTRNERLDIRIGEEPVFVTPKRGFDIHLGNYGLLHRIRLKLINHGENETHNLDLLYTAKGGLARGVFLINGELYDTDLLDAQENKSEKILSVSIPPKTSKILEILLMPQPGSFYPTLLSVVNKHK